jgi:hypothetical protein
MKITVFRIEGENKNGPYSKYFSWKHQDHGDDNHPTPKEEVFVEGDLNLLEQMQSGSCIHCAFKDLKQMKDWFNSDELEAMSKNNFRLKTYEVDKKDCCFFQKQLIFNRANAQEIANETLRILF